MIRHFALIAAVALGNLLAEDIVSSTFISTEQMIPLLGSGEDASSYAPDGGGPAGATFELAGGGKCDVWMRDNAARMHNGGAVAITLAGKNADAILTISADISFEALPPDEELLDSSKEPLPEAQIGAMKAAMRSGVALLGFYSELPKLEYANMLNAFTGFQVSFDGSLQLFINGQPSGPPAPFAGTFDPAEPRKLTCSVNTRTGAVVKVEFESSSTPYDFSTTGFTKDATAFAGIGGTLGNQALHAEFRNFLVRSEAAATPP